ncbi:MAG: ECF transporter S component [Peptostreptococcaceae bacterium]|nr:ECF transporter S component [Peptostreptococcaceae bacterium]
MKETRQMTKAALFLAVSVILSSIFHMSGIDGRIFLPMHIPVLLAGFFLSPLMAFIVGLLAPFLNTLVTGMPVLFPIAIIMSVELGIYGLVTALISGSKRRIPIIALIVAMVVGRLAAGGMVYVLVVLFGVKINPLIYLQGAVLTGIPGIAIQLLLIPLLLKYLKGNRSQ